MPSDDDDLSFTPIVSKILSNNKNSHGLNHRQWMFAEHYVQHLNADRAYSEVYCSSNTRNAWVILKSRALIKYIRERLQEKQATLEAMTDRANTTLMNLTKSSEEKIRLDASKAIHDYKVKCDEISVRLKIAEAGHTSEKALAEKGPVIINITPATKEDNSPSNTDEK